MAVLSDHFSLLGVGFSCTTPLFFWEELCSWMSNKFGFTIRAGPYTRNKKLVCISSKIPLTKGVREAESMHLTFRFPSIKSIVNMKIRYGIILQIVLSPDRSVRGRELHGDKKSSPFPPRTQCFVSITAATAVILLKFSPLLRLPRFYRGSNQC